MAWGTCRPAAGTRGVLPPSQARGLSQVSQLAVQLRGLLVPRLLQPGKTAGEPPIVRGGPTGRQMPALAD